METEPCTSERSFLTSLSWLGERAVAHKFLDALLYTRVHKTELLGPIVPQADSRGISTESLASKLVKVPWHQSLAFIFSAYFDKESLTLGLQNYFASRRKEDKEGLFSNIQGLGLFYYIGAV